MPLNAIYPPAKEHCWLKFGNCIFDVETHVFPVMLQIVTRPILLAVALEALSVNNPVVLDVFEIVPDINEDELAYPVVVGDPPVPNCICTLDVPVVETSVNIKVIRFTQDGILVKSMLVPLVEATAVPATILELRPFAVIVAVPVGSVSVPDPEGNTIVFEPAVAGADSVTLPLVSPEMTIELIIILRT